MHRQKTRYQFTDGQGKRRHFATKAKAKVEAAKDKALYRQEGRLAAGLTDEQRRDAASAVKLLPLGWTNSVAIVRRHYNAALEPAAAWWQIRPAKQENVVPIEAAE